MDLKCDIPPIILELCSRSRSQAGLGAVMLNQTLTVYKELYMCSTYKFDQTLLNVEKDSLVALETPSLSISTDLLSIILYCTMYLGSWQHLSVKIKS